MEYLQYLKKYLKMKYSNGRFKPYYKWNTFNTITDITQLVADIKF